VGANGSGPPPGSRSAPRRGRRASAIRWTAASRRPRAPGRWASGRPGPGVKRASGNAARGDQHAALDAGRDVARDAAVRPRASIACIAATMSGAASLRWRSWGRSWAGRRRAHQLFGGLEPSQARPGCPGPGRPGPRTAPARRSASSTGQPRSRPAMKPAPEGIAATGRGRPGRSRGREYGPGHPRPPARRRWPIGEHARRRRPGRAARGPLRPGPSRPDRRRASAGVGHEESTEGQELLLNWSIADLRGGDQVAGERSRPPPWRPASSAAQHAAASRRPDALGPRRSARTAPPAPPWRRAGLSYEHAGQRPRP